MSNMKKSELLWDIMKDILIASAGENLDSTLEKIQYVMKEYEFEVLVENRSETNV